MGTMQQTVKELETLALELLNAMASVQRLGEAGEALWQDLNASRRNVMRHAAALQAVR